MQPLASIKDLADIFRHVLEGHTREAIRVVAVFTRQTASHIAQGVNMKLISGSAHPTLAKEVAEVTGVPLTDVTISAFPDGETLVQINENIRGEDVFIIQPTSPPTNHNLMELLITVDAARRASARSITAVIPFFGYARQDRKDKSRMPITAKLVANLIQAAGIDRVITLDLHAAQIQGFFDIPVDHLSAEPTLVHYIWDQLNGDTSNLTLVAPDVGAVKLAKRYAQSLNSEFAIVAKHRVSATKVEAMNVIGDVEGRDVLIIDDMTETAGTLCAAAKILKDSGAAKISAGVSHAVIGEMGHRRILESEIDQVLTTNSTPVQETEKVKPLSIAPFLGEAILRISQAKSVSSLFDINLTVG